MIIGNYEQCFDRKLNPAHYMKKLFHQLLRYYLMDIRPQANWDRIRNRHVVVDRYGKEQDCAFCNCKAQGVGRLHIKLAEFLIPICAYHFQEYHATHGGKYPSWSSHLYRPIKINLKHLSKCDSLTPVPMTSHQPLMV